MSTVNKTIDFEHAIWGRDFVQAMRYIALALLPASLGDNIDEILIIEKTEAQGQTLYEITMQPLIGLPVRFAKKNTRTGDWNSKIDPQEILYAIRISYPRRHESAPYSDVEERTAIQEIMDRMRTLLNLRVPA